MKKLIIIIVCCSTLNAMENHNQRMNQSMFLKLSRLFDKIGDPARRATPYYKISLSEESQAILSQDQESLQTIKNFSRVQLAYVGSEGDTLLHVLAKADYGKCANGRETKALRALVRRKARFLLGASVALDAKNADGKTVTTIITERLETMKLCAETCEHSNQCSRCDQKFWLQVLQETITEERKQKENKKD